jgi:hypothetical protein
MKQPSPQHTSSGSTVSHPGAADALEARFALRVGAALTESSVQLSPDIAERLRFAREQAVSRRKQPAVQVAPAWAADTQGGSAVLRGGPHPKRLLWVFASVVPWVLLFAGLFYIHDAYLERQVREVADIDAALLADDLPPQAYADPGFAAFLKATGR